MRNLREKVKNLNFLTNWPILDLFCPEMATFRVSPRRLDFMQKIEQSNVWIFWQLNLDIRTEGESLIDFVERPKTAIFYINFACCLKRKKCHLIFSKNRNISTYCFSENLGTRIGWNLAVSHRIGPAKYTANNINKHA